MRRSIIGNPTFEVDGSFSADYYRDVLRSNGLSPDQYRAEQGNTDQLIKLESIIADADFITPVEAKAAIDVVVERRDVRFLVVPDTALSPPLTLMTRRLRHSMTLIRDYSLNPSV